MLLHLTLYSAERIALVELPLPIGDGDFNALHSIDRTEHVDDRSSGHRKLDNVLTLGAGIVDNKRKLVEADFYPVFLQVVEHLLRDFFGPLMPVTASTEAVAVD